MQASQTRPQILAADADGPRGQCHLPFMAGLFLQRVFPLVRLKIPGSPGFFEVDRHVGVVQIRRGQ